MDQPSSLEWHKARLAADVRALFDLQFPEGTSEHVKLLGPNRTGEIGHPFERDLYSLLEQDSRKLVQIAVRQAIERDGRLRPAQAVSIPKETYSFLENLWPTTGNLPVDVLIAARMVRDPPAHFSRTSAKIVQKRLTGTWT
jgi:hypothetical protein